MTETIFFSRHSRAGGNPDTHNTRHAVGQLLEHGVVRYAEHNGKLDSRLRGNDNVVGFAYRCIRLKRCLQLSKDQ